MLGDARSLPAQSQLTVERLHDSMDASMRAATPSTLTQIRLRSPARPAAPNRMSVRVAALDIKDAKAAPLFTPFQLAGHDLAIRMVYPPLTRLRASFDNVPQPIMAEYYGQRAAPGGLVIAEGTYISAAANGYPAAPGIWNATQVEAWKPVVKAVKDKSSVFFCQLWHCGRASHPALQPGGVLPIAPSAIAVGQGFQVYLPDFTAADYPVPQELDVAGIKAVIGEYATAAKNAIAAGFDGVELHGATGYLVEQFTKDSTNKRTDEYGGSLENRCRFALEVVAALVDAVGADKVGIRLSPYSDFLNAVDSDPVGTYSYLVDRLNAFGLAYLHLIEPRVAGANDVEGDVKETLGPFRKIWKGTVIAAGGYKAHNAAEAITSGHADLISFGRWWLANPDLPKRFALGAPLNKYDRNTFYGASDPAKGYIDYPVLEDVPVA